MINALIAFFKLESYEVPIYRLWAIIVGFFLPIYGLFLLNFVPDSIDSIAHRVYFSIYWFSILILSFTNKWIKLHLPFFCYLGNLATITWILWIVSVNHFSPEYSIGLIIAFSCMGILNRNKWEVISYCTFFIVVLSYLLFYIEEPGVNAPVYFLSLMILTLVYSLNILRHSHVNTNLSLLNQRLIQKNEDLERFVYVASHDLKSPLRIIGSFSSLMKRRMGNNIDKDVSDYLDYILNGIVKMNNVIDDLLKYSKYGYSLNSFEKINIKPLIEEIAHDFQKIDKVEISISEQIPLKIKVIPTQIRQLFQNIIENGIKYNRSPVKKIDISYQEDSKFNTFIITDNGIGIEEDYKDKIFELFQRLEHNEEFNGTGVGLAICKRIVEHHKGTITFDSDKAKGTSFIFSLAK